ncbi:hypothetical protein [Demequina sp. NBRC 110051]|uniref:hypothetical protein n=1 Tax=Demequina sp. NBRC 110051 TaxID=1570340 RepID=UPI000A02D707|nr:hypothetical protein [Demequina sp. NBRC 110051]
MIVPKHGLISAARLRQSLAGVRRVIIARADGIALYDDVPLAERDGGAALTAAVNGLAATVATSFTLGVAGANITLAEQGALVVCLIDAGHLLAILVDAQTDLTAALRAAGAEAEHLRALSNTRIAS